VGVGGGRGGCLVGGGGGVVVMDVRGWATTVMRYGLHGLGIGWGENGWGIPGMGSVDGSGMDSLVYSFGFRVGR